MSDLKTRKRSGSEFRVFLAPKTVFPGRVFVRLETLSIMLCGNINSTQDIFLAQLFIRTIKNILTFLNINLKINYQFWMKYVGTEIQTRGF